VTSYPNSSPRKLLGSHRHTLEVGSAIAREVLKENGVYSIGHGSELPEGFSGRQRRRAPGMLFVAPRPNGKTSYSFRPDGVDPRRPGHRYEQPCKALGGPGNVLALPVGSRHLVDDVRIPVVFVEGIKKMLAVVSAARRDGAVVLVVAISGVWNWLSGGEPIPDMLDIPMEGREVYIGFDSDVFRNPDVTDAARRLAVYLAERGAEVFLSYLRDQADGSKTGADDYLAAGHSYGEYMATFRPFDAAELQRERIARSATLRAALLDLERRFWAFAWSGTGGHSDRDVFRVLIDAAWQSGKAVADGVKVRIAWGPLEVRAKVSRRTLSKALARLEAAGLLYRVPDEEKPGRAGAFVLCGSVNQYGEGEGTNPVRTPNGIHSRAPRLRWSSPGSKTRLGLVSGTRRVRGSQRLRPRPPVKRLGKIRGALVDALDVAGGTLTLEELAAALHRKRPRDLARRRNPETGKGRDGPLIMLEEAGILTIDGDTVNLTDRWLEALEDQRRLGREIDTVDVNGRVEAGADTLAFGDLERRRAEYRERMARRRVRKRRVSEAGRKAIEESNAKRAAYLAAVGDRRKAARATSALAATVRDYLERHPHDARQPAGWIGVTLWAHELHPGKPTPAEVKAALEELGGAAYLDGLLKRAGRRVA
jgi:DNA-binding transcriptional ArsR family regulator